MIWLAVIALAVAGLAAMWWAARPSRAGVEVIAAALLIGLAGYAWQGRPGLPGAPHEASAAAMGDGAASVQERALFTGNAADANPPARFYIIVADALVRHGQFADAAAILSGATTRNPHDAEAWLALGNALVGNAEGTISPAARLAYARAAAADPGAPGPPFFLALALGKSGELTKARAIWAGLLAQAPAAAKWRGDAAHRLAQVDAAMMIARAQGESR